MFVFMVLTAGKEPFPACSSAWEQGEVWRAGRKKLESGLSLLTVVSSSFGILIREKYFPVRSLETLKVPAPGHGCFSPPGDSDEQLVRAFGNSFVITFGSQQREGPGMQEAKQTAGEKMEEQSSWQRTGRQNHPRLWGNQARP